MAASAYLPQSTERACCYKDFLRRNVLQPGHALPGPVFTASCRLLPPSNGHSVRDCGQLLGDAAQSNANYQLHTYVRQALAHVSTGIRSVHNRDAAGHASLFKSPVPPNGGKIAALKVNRRQRRCRCVICTLCCDVRTCCSPCSALALSRCSSHAQCAPLLAVVYPLPRSLLVHGLCLFSECVATWCSERCVRLGAAFRRALSLLPGIAFDKVCTSIYNTRRIIHNLRPCCARVIRHLCRERCCAACLQPVLQPMSHGVVTAAPRRPVPSHA